MSTKINEKDQLFEKDNATGENQGALLPNQRGRYLTASSLEETRLSIQPANTWVRLRKLCWISKEEN
jgi:hypothetical protein